MSGRLPDDAFVVRGGLNRPQDLRRKFGTHPSGLPGFSVESSPGLTPTELAQNVPHGKIGVTTVGRVRAAGGDVIPTSGQSPNHATVTGLSPEQVSRLLAPVIPNPARR